jgi:hypothetical protein
MDVVSGANRGRRHRLVRDVTEGGAFGRLDRHERA